MKRIVSLIGALLMCFTLASTAFAETNTFVPSISYKDGPDIEDAALNGEDVSGCLVVSSITDAKNESTDITQDERDTLLDVYDQLSDGSMELPLENEGYVIRELVDVSFRHSSCVEAGHDHKEKLAEAGVTVAIDFDLGVKADTEVVVFAYVDGQWVRIENVTNNGDGTLTCVFEDICPVAFCVEEGAEDEPPYTGISAERNLILWVAVMIVSLAAIVMLLVQRRKHAR